jgi:hypothetical protein
MKSSSRNFKRIILLDRKSGHKQTDTYSEIAKTASSFGNSSATIAEIAWAVSMRTTEASIYSFLRLAHRYSGKRLEAACKRVLFYGFDSIDMVKIVLFQKLDLLPLNRKTDIYGQPELF